MSDADELRIEDAVFVVVDFETLTPTGRPPEPIEFAMAVSEAMARRIRLERDWLIKPPVGVPVTPFDTAQTGITEQMLVGGPDASQALREADELVDPSRSVLVAHNARYEGNIIERFRESCPGMSSMAFVDTVRLAKFLLASELPSFKLDVVASHFHIRIPPDRHRADADVRMTTEVLARLLDIAGGRQLSRIRDLVHVAGFRPAREQTSSQESLF